MLRVGRISYANCTPIFSGLREQATCRDCQFVEGVPSRLNGMLAAGEIDVCPSSSIEYAHHPDNYLILPNLSISSVGAVGSVLLFSRVPIVELSGQTILLSSESATSVNLLRILLAIRFKATCQYIPSSLPLERALQDAPAMLLIGDAALRAALEGNRLRVYDLGELWHRWTGLPFVFALWLCGRRVAEEHHAAVSRLASQLVTAKEHAGRSIESIAQEAPEALWMGKERLVAYWRDNISYDLGRRHLEGLALFYRYCVDLGLLKSEPGLRFLGNDRNGGD